MQIYAVNFHNTEVLPLFGHKQNKEIRTEHGATYQPRLVKQIYVEMRE